MYQVRVLSAIFFTEQVSVVKYWRLCQQFRLIQSRSSRRRRVTAGRPPLYDILFGHRVAAAPFCHARQSVRPSLAEQTVILGVVAVHLTHHT